MITTAPVCIYTVIVDELSFQGMVNDFDSTSVYLLLVTLSYFNNAINFWIYCVSGPKFRAELLAMVNFKCGITNQPPDTENRL